VTVKHHAWKQPTGPAGQEAPRRRRSGAQGVKSIEVADLHDRRSAATARRKTGQDPPLDAQIGSPEHLGCQLTKAGSQATSDQDAAPPRGGPADLRSTASGSRLVAP